jgi:hypothetical protein
MIIVRTIKRKLGVVQKAMNPSATVKTAQSRCQGNTLSSMRKKTRKKGLKRFEIPLQVRLR